MWRSVRRTVSPSNQVVFILISVSKAVIMDYEKREGGDFFLTFTFFLCISGPAQYSVLDQSPLTLVWARSPAFIRSQAEAESG